MAETLVAQEDGQRTALVSNFFHFVGNVLAGSDSNAYVNPGFVRSDGLLGPVGAGNDVFLAADGNLYRRGVAAGPAAGAPVATVAGLSITPGMLMLAAVAYFVLRR